MIHLAGGMGRAPAAAMAASTSLPRSRRAATCSSASAGTSRRGLHHQEENIPAFRKRINQYVRTHCGDWPPVSSLEIDAALTRPSLITLQEVEELSPSRALRRGQQPPCFCLRGARLESMQSVGQNKHLKLRLQKGHTSFDGIFFSVTPAECGLTVGERVDAAFYLQINEFRGSRSLQLQLVDLRSAHDPGAREAEQQAVPHADPRRRREREGRAKPCPRASSSCASGVRSSARWTARSPLQSCPFLRRLSAEAPARRAFRARSLPRGFCRARARDRRAPRQIHHAPSHRRQAVDLDASPYLCALREGLEGTRKGGSEGGTKKRRAPPHSTSPPPPPGRWGSKTTIF